MSNILWAVFWFALFGGLFGFALAVASKFLAVKTDPRAEQITELLPGANCGGCGNSGCAAMAQAILDGKSNPSSCNACTKENLAKICEIAGVAAAPHERLRAQVMCSGTAEFSKKKYVYNGAHDCISAQKLGGGDKLCPNGCIGLGTCVERCPFGAISVVDGVAVVDYHKCTGCGVCALSCPKHLIKLIPYDSPCWVGCMSVDKGSVTRSYCDVGCISCHLCEKSCGTGAIKVNDFVASIEYDKCVGCGKCLSACPRKIIWSGETQKRGPVIVDVPPTPAELGTR